LERSAKTGTRRLKLPLSKVEEGREGMAPRWRDQILTSEATKNKQQVTPIPPCGVEKSVQYSQKIGRSTDRIAKKFVGTKQTRGG